MLHALAEIGDAPPIQCWLPLALADVVCSIAALAGSQMSRRDVLASWGVVEPVDTAAEILLRYGISEPQSSTAGH